MRPGPGAVAGADTAASTVFGATGVALHTPAEARPRPSTKAPLRINERDITRSSMSSQTLKELSGVLPKDYNRERLGGSTCVLRPFYGRGRRISKIEPFPGVLFTDTDPPCAST